LGSQLDIVITLVDCDLISLSPRRRGGFSFAVLTQGKAEQWSVFF
jgi:hypothetical protein